jgi:SOS-response transcriptional repressor LexA
MSKDYKLVRVKTNKIIEDCKITLKSGKIQVFDKDGNQMNLKFLQYTESGIRFKDLNGDMFDVIREDNLKYAGIKERN